MNIAKYGKEIVIGLASGVGFHYWAADKIDATCIQLVDKAQGLIGRAACIPQAQGWDLWIVPILVGVGIALAVGIIYDKVKN